MPEPPRDWAPYLGRRVSIRYRLHDDSDPFSEAVGVLTSVDDEGDAGPLLAILNRRGDRVRVAATDILAAKFWPAE